MLSRRRTENVDPQMPPERLSRQCATKFAQEVSLRLKPNPKRRNLAGIRGEFDGLGKERKLFYINNLDWLGRQDSNLGSRDQSPLPYHLATPQSAARMPACPQLQAAD